MNAIAVTQIRAHRRSGQTIYQVMLIISCAALAIAIFFPTYEYIELYRKPQETITPVAVEPETKPLSTPTETSTPSVPAKTTEPTTEPPAESAPGT